jgi:4,5-DOPA dioxygenase extradiol
MKFPAVFVSHGAPTMPLETTDPTHVFLRGLGPSLGKPRAVVCVSSHWEAPQPTLGTAPRLSAIHDFSGFPEALYKLQYSAPGDPALAGRARSLLESAGIKIAEDPKRGLDHGAWVPLSLMYPEADVPIVPLSVQSRRDAAYHAALGAALAPLREEDVLVLGTGGATHDLRRADFRAGENPPEDVQAFEEWLVRSIEAGATEDLLAWQARAPHAASNHPTPEHLFPLFVPLGTAGKGARGHVLHRRFAYGALSMAAFAWD